jgi:hypothetical protein
MVAQVNFARTYTALSHPSGLVSHGDAELV